MSIRAGLGLIHGGELTPTDQPALEVKPGGLLAVGFEYMIHQGNGYLPYLDVSLFVSGSSTQIEDRVTKKKTDYFSSDLRLAGRASWNINGNIFPYFSGGVFGGPVSWEIDGKDVTGTDIHNYQLAMGSAIQFGSIGTFVEWAGFGEKALSAGVSYAW